MRQDKLLMRHISCKRRQCSRTLGIAYGAVQEQVIISIDLVQVSKKTNRSCIQSNTVRAGKSSTRSGARRSDGIVV